MAKITIEYCSKYKSYRRSFGGQPVPVGGAAAVPFRKDLYDLKEDDYDDANFTTHAPRRNSRNYHVIGFMPIKEECWKAT